MIPRTATPSVPYGERDTALNNRILKSLRLQLFCAVLISFAVGLAAFGIAFFLGDALLDQTVYGQTFAETMADQHFSQLQEYVEEEEISLTNLQRLNPWCSRGDKVYLTIYQGDTLIYESAQSRRIRGGLNVQEYDPDLEDPENKYTLVLDGNVRVRAFLYYYSGDAFFYGLLVVSGLVSFLAFSLCFITLISRKISYIDLIKKELDILSGGQLEYEVTVHGSDEIGELAQGIDQMRRSILKHQEVEDQMRSANSELITAMSHDLRTPLTSLLAYLEIIQRKKYSDDHQMDQLVQKSIHQTLRIKNMADQLFEYFLVYATDWESDDLETVDADQLFQQILEDYAYSLESSGMTVHLQFSPVSGKIQVAIPLLQRALDNLYSNLTKYADPEVPIIVCYERKNDHLHLSVSNGSRPDQNKRESTSIGLNTCRRIMEHHGGTFASEEHDGVFSVSVTIPLQI